MSSEELAEVAVEQCHQVMLEVKEYLEDTADTPKGQKLLGKVELMLDNWDDDAFFGEQALASEEDEDLDDEDEDEDDGEEEDEGLDDGEEEDEGEDEGSILDAEDEDDD